MAFSSLFLIFFSFQVVYCAFGTYPQILLCSKNSTFPNANCAVRTGAGVPFDSCNGQQNIQIQVYADDNSTEYCSAFTISENAEDPYSIVTFTTDINQGLLVDHVLLIGPNDDLPNIVDGYIELIYLYRSSALITILSTSNGPKGQLLYTSTLHTEYRNYPPQYIWIKFAPSYQDGF